VRAIVSADFRRICARLKRRGHRLCRSDVLVWAKRMAHRRHRGAQRAYLQRGDWDAAIESRPLSGWDLY